MKRCRLLFAIGSFFAVVLSSHAQFTWTGLGGDNLSSNPANWLGGVAPIGDGTENIIFGNSPQNFVIFPSVFAVNDITMTANPTYYFIGGGGDNLTLNGNVTTTMFSSPFLVFGETTLTLSAGTHTFDAQGTEGSGSDIYLFGSLAGSGNLVKTGLRSLIISSPDGASTYTGNISLQQGDLGVAGDGSLGTGIVTMAGGRIVVPGYDTDHAVKLYNNFEFTDNVNFGSYFNTPSLLTITGSATALSGYSTINFNTDSQTQVTIQGTVGEQDPNTQFVFSGGGLVTLGGAATYTGGTEATFGSQVIFAAGPPATGMLRADNGGYIGTEVTANIQTNFINHFDPAGTDGIIGFDSPIISAPQTFAGPIDLTGFNPGARLGTATSAILTGLITPQDDGSDEFNYQFGGHGTLFVNSNLADYSGTSDVQVHDGLSLYLGGNNTYTGDTEAVAGAIIFNSANAIPVGADLYADASGYIGQTESAGIGGTIIPDAATYFARFYTPDTFGVVGFDADNPVAGRIISEDIDFSSFDQGAYLGTSTNVTFTGNITPNATTYRFSGYRDGHLTIASTLTGVGYDVVIGINGSDIVTFAPPGQAYHPSVELDGPNTYTGGTTLQSGQLILGNATALGTGTLTINANYAGGQQVPGLTTSVPGVAITNPISFISSNGFYLGGPNDFSLLGNLTSSGEGIEKLDANTVTLGGDNSGFDGYFNVRNGNLVFTTDTAAGSAAIFLDDVDGSHGNVSFTSNNPSMGSLSGRSVTTLDLGPGTLTVNQLTQDTFSGTISGSGNLVVNSTGILTLDGNNTYTGNTTVTGGATLLAGSNSALGGTVTVNGGTLGINNGVLLPNPVSFGIGGGTLSGNGTFGSAISIGANGNLGPGDQVGLVGHLAFASGLTFAPSSTFSFDVQSATGARGVGYDTLDVIGGLTFTATLGSPLVLSISSVDGSGGLTPLGDFDNSMGYAWLIAHSDGLSGFNPNNISINTSNFLNSLGAGGFSISNVGNDVFLNFSPVPEPSTYALLASGLAALAFGYRRNRSRLFRNRRD